MLEQNMTAAFADIAETVYLRNHRGQSNDSLHDQNAVILIQHGQAERLYDFRSNVVNARRNRA